LQPSFTDAFKRQLWGLSDSETISGPGSTLRYTEKLRALLPTLLSTLGCARLLDAPCGDFNWMRAVPLPGVAYQGADIVPEIVETLRERYPAIAFTCLDITADPLPPVDFWLCRDVLLHMSDDAIRAVVQNYLRSGIRYFATTHYFDRGEFDAYFGEGAADPAAGPLTFRFVNLMAPPFNMPAPDYMIRDYVEGFPRRWLAVWDRQSLGDYAG
jgi:hypothetical protein